MHVGERNNKVSETIAAHKRPAISFGTSTPHLKYECGKHGVQMVFFMLTNILDESTELICYGEGTADVIRNAFGLNIEDSACVLRIFKYFSLSNPFFNFLNLIRIFYHQLFYTTFCYFKIVLCT